jgi:hypothetical protein
MKQKISFPGFLLPFLKRSWLKIRSVNSTADRVQYAYAMALLILWLLVFWFIETKH